MLGAAGACHALAGPSQRSLQASCIASLQPNSFARSDRHQAGPHTGMAERGPERGGAPPPPQPSPDPPRHATGSQQFRRCCARTCLLRLRGGVSAAAACRQLRLRRPPRRLAAPLLPWRARLYRAGASGLGWAAGCCGCRRAATRPLLCGAPLPLQSLRAGAAWRWGSATVPPTLGSVGAALRDAPHPLHSPQPPQPQVMCIPKHYMQARCPRRASCRAVPR